MKIDWRVVVVGMICITLAEIVAICNGINGTLYSIYLIIIAGAIGVTLPSPLKKDL